MCRQVEWGIGCGERLTGEQDVPIVDWGIGCGDWLIWETWCADRLTGE